MDRSRCLKLVRGATARGREVSRLPDMSREFREKKIEYRLPAAMPVNSNGSIKSFLRQLRHIAVE